ncbi:MAG: 16S rRNA (adenine(1518)-N(6)/adenine(1519)-N(6))-dimethyltransferase RsmA [bacterium]|nr:16S rRNA (adenine(1518)-N(6)/adenine(1519)-N(6))-dimethyltransferase RsmA [bacterium]
MRDKGIALKKKYGQHFLQESTFTQQMLDAVTLDHTSSVFEIGCGNGFLTKAILTTNGARLWVFEIDPEWVDYVKAQIKDPRLQVFNENFLDIDFSRLQEYVPWTVLANIPYQITFPILHLLQKNRHLLKEGVIMVQEEVAQKIIKKSGRGYGYTSLFFQWYFEWRMLAKVPPSAFNPPPKVFSRLLYFKPRKISVSIPDEEQFWRFIKSCFQKPRRTLRNNLRQTHYDVGKIANDILDLRAQQMSMDDLLNLWEILR